MAVENYKRNVGGFIIAMVCATYLLVVISNFIALSFIQIVAVVLFLNCIFGSLFFWRFRLAFATASIALMLALKVLDVEHFIEFAHLDVIVFLIGMMIVIGFLESKQFFDHILELFLRRVGASATKFVIGTLVLAAFFAALVDEVTSILFMTALVLKVTARYNMHPLPLLIATVFATNIGSSFTVIGNPVGVLIAFEGKLTFLDFIIWATPTALAVLAITIVLVFIYWKQYILDMDKAMKAEARCRKTNRKKKKPCDKENKLNGNEKSSSGSDSDSSDNNSSSEKSYTLCWIVFICTIMGLVLHHPIEELLALSKNTLLLAVPLISAGIVLVLSREDARYIVEVGVDWWTLAFFLFFFASVGTLMYVGVTMLMAGGMIVATGGNEITTTIVFTWLSGWMSAFMDNILAVATLIQIVKPLADFGVNTFPSWWGLLFGACYLGNLTMIGSTANIVALGQLERRRHIHITFMDWFKPGVVVAIPQLLLATGLLYLVHFVIVPLI